MKENPEVIINLEAIKKNYQTVKNNIGHAICGAVVKSNAYGLGVEKVSRALFETGCRLFFVSTSVEGIELRKILKDEVEIVVLQGVNEKNIHLFYQNNLIPVLNNLQQCQIFEKNISNFYLSPAIHVDCGFNRLGLKKDDIKNLNSAHYTFLKRGIRMVMSHLTCADNPNNTLNQVQKKRFDSLRSLLPDAPASLSASDAQFISSEYVYDIVRPGAALYGLNTDPNRIIKMETVVTIQAPIIHVGKAKYGDFVGYGATYKAKKDVRYAVLSIGYADGIPRNIGNQGVVWFEDKNNRFSAPIIGRISMDMVTCDVSEVPSDLIQIGNMGSFINSYYGVGEMIKKSECFGSEIFTHFSRRVQRIYE